MSYRKLTFAKKKIIVNKTKFWFIGLFIFVFLVFGIWFFLSTFDPVRWPTISPLAFIVSLPLVILLVLITYKAADWVSMKMDEKMDIYEYNWEIAERGDTGEDLVHEALQKLLNAEEYRIYRNIALPNVKSDLDIIVVGPHGIILFEVKNYKDTHVRYTRTKSFYKCKNNSWREIKPDLRMTVHWRAKQLEKYLAEHGADKVIVRKVILYVNPASVEIKEYGGKHVYVIQGLDKLRNYLESSRPDKNFTLDLCAEVNDILQKFH